MSRKDPFNQFTRGVVEGYENTPEFRAMREGNNFAPTSWGDLASKMIKADMIEPSVEAACDYLCIDKDQFASPEPTIGRSYDALEYHFEKAEEKKHVAIFGASAQVFSDYLAEQMSAWRPGHEVAQERFEAAKEEYTAIRQTYDDDMTDEECDQMWGRANVKELEVKAYQSGTAVLLPEFVATILSCPDESYFNNETLSQMLQVFLKRFDRIPSDTPAESIFLSRGDVEEFFSMMRRRFEKPYEAIAQQKLEAVLSLIRTPEHEEHSLFTGDVK